MQRSDFSINQMDCPSEEKLIRLKLGSLDTILHLDFDIPERRLSVFHKGDPQAIESLLEELELGSRRLCTEEVKDLTFEKDQSQQKLLWTVLLINFGFFLIEMVSGWISNSMGLIADSLDMLADSLVYGLSLMAVGAVVARKKRIARHAGYFQLALAVLGFAEILRRFIGDMPLPDFRTMVGVSILALLANGICLFLLQRSQSKNEAHMKASMIFTSNDVIINLGVITAAIMVSVFNSPLPDLVIGSIVFLLVVRGAFRILKLG